MLEAASSFGGRSAAAAEGGLNLSPLSLLPPSGSGSSSSSVLRERGVQLVRTLAKQQGVELPEDGGAERVGVLDSASPGGAVGEETLQAAEK